MSEAVLKRLGVGKRMPDDPLFAPGDALCRMFVREGIVDIDDEELCHQIMAVFPCEVIGCRERFSSLMDFEMHYNSRHRFICSQCRKPLPTAHFLDLHLSETHDSFFAAQAERKPMFRCFVEECSVLSRNVAERRTHCIEAHSFPHDFRYDQSHRKNKKTNSSGGFKSKKNNKSDAMVVEEHHENNKTNSSGGFKSKKDNKSDAVVVEEHHERKQHTRKPFTFGQSKQGKSFGKSNKPWHAEGKSSVESNQPNGDITTAELMDTLPEPSEPTGPV